MEILNNFRNIILGLFLLFSNPNMYGEIYDLARIDTVRIAYSHLGGYAIYRSVACYVLHNCNYEVQTEEYNVQEVPKTIHKEAVTRLLNNCNQYALEDCCNYLKITKKDYSNYKKILKDSICDYIPFFQDSLKDEYELTEDYYLSLSCNDIIRIIESSNDLFTYYKPQLKIELVNADHEIISIEPQWYFEGTAWNVKFCSKIMYIDFEHIISFLKEIQLKEEYYHFAERFYLLFQIANNVSQRITGKSSQITGDGSSASERLL